MQTVVDEEHLVEVPRWVVHCEHGIQDIGDGHGAGIQEFVEQGPVFVTEPPQVVEEEMRLAFPYIVVVDHPLQHPLSAYVSVHRSSTKCIFVGKLHKIKPPPPPKFNHQTCLLHPLTLRSPEDLILSLAPPDACVGKACPVVDTAGKRRENSSIRASIPLIYPISKLDP